MMKAKNPMSVTVTATMAAIRAAPNDLMNWTKSCTLPDPLVLPLGKNCLVHGYCLVKIVIAGVKIAIARRRSGRCSGASVADLLQWRCCWSAYRTRSAWPKNLGPNTATPAQTSRRGSRPLKGEAPTGDTAEYAWCADQRARAGQSNIATTGILRP